MTWLFMPVVCGCKEFYEAVAKRIVLGCFRVLGQRIMLGCYSICHLHIPSKGSQFFLKYSN
jgi:hypothetical protein